MLKMRKKNMNKNVYNEQPYNIKAKNGTFYQWAL